MTGNGILNRLFRSGGRQRGAGAARMAPARPPASRETAAFKP